MRRYDVFRSVRFGSNQTRNDRKGSRALIYVPANTGSTVGFDPPNFSPWNERDMTLHLTEQESMLRVEGLKKVFRSGESDLVLFENLSFEVKRGEMLAIVGESGAGKSTLLHILSALDRASAGDVYCAHLRLNSLSHDEAADFRNRETGFVWQFHYLLPEFTAAENVAMPLLLARADMAAGRARSFTLAARGRTGAARASSLRRAFGRRAAAGGSGPRAHHRSQAVAGR